MSASLREVLASADVLFDRAAVEQAIGAMADVIRDDYTDGVDTRPVYLTVMHGGMPFASQLAMELGVRGLDLEFDYLHATRYRGATSGGALVWKHRPATALRGRRVLLVDDIFDEGLTMAAIVEWCLAEGAVDVRIAALAVKHHDRAITHLQADYVGLQVPDRYVFGYGMDYQEQGRNLPAIYALKD